MKPVRFDTGVRFDDPNLRWGNPSYLLEPGDPGYVPPSSATTAKPTKKKRKYMASNPTPTRLEELIAAGEDLCDGLHQHETTLLVKQNTEAATRADLDALIGAKNAVAAAEGAQPTAYNALRVADSNAKGFIAASVKVLSLSLGNDWSDAWLATGLPNNTVGVPRTQDERFTALGGLKAYFTANPGQENAPLNITAAQATTLHTAVSTARNGVGHALSAAKGAVIVQEQKREAFRARYRGAITELEQLLEEEDPRWYDFGLSRPADPATPGQPSNVHVTALGSGRVLIQIDGARRANSFNYYRQITGTDPEPVKATNTEGTQYTLEGLAAGANVVITVTGVNDAGEGQPSEPVNVVVT
jgi:hypothetical protein